MFLLLFLLLMKMMLMMSMMLIGEKMTKEHLKHNEKDTDDGDE